jgi:hypothetical protein
VVTVVTVLALPGMLTILRVMPIFSPVP